MFFQGGICVFDIGKETFEMHMNKNEYHKLFISHIY